MDKDELSIYGQLEYDHVWAKAKIIIQNTNPTGDARPLQLTDPVAKLQWDATEWNNFIWLLTPPHTSGPKEVYNLTETTTFHDIVIRMTLFCIQWLDEQQRIRTIQNANAYRSQNQSQHARHDGDYNESG